MRLTRFSRISLIGVMSCSILFTLPAFAVPNTEEETNIPMEDVQRFFKRYCTNQTVLC